MLAIEIKYKLLQVLLNVSLLQGFLPLNNKYANILIPWSPYKRVNLYYFSLDVFLNEYRSSFF